MCLLQQIAILPLAILARWCNLSAWRLEIYCNRWKLSHTTYGFKAYSCSETATNTIKYSVLACKQEGKGTTVLFHQCACSMSNSKIQNGKNQCAFSLYAAWFRDDGKCARVLSSGTELRVLPTLTVWHISEKLAAYTPAIYHSSFMWVKWVLSFPCVRN